MTARTTTSKAPREEEPVFATAPHKTLLMELREVRFYDDEWDGNLHNGDYFVLKAVAPVVEFCYTFPKDPEAEGRFAVLIANGVWRGLPPWHAVRVNGMYVFAGGSDTGTLRDFVNYEIELMSKRIDQNMKNLNCTPSPENRSKWFSKMRAQPVFETNITTGKIDPGMWVWEE